jgi:hypothetical protein
LGKSFCVPPLCRSNEALFNEEMSLLCRKLRFTRYFQSALSTAETSPYVKPTPKFSTNPPSSLDCEFESDMLELEKCFFFSDENRQKPTWKNQCLHFLCKQRNIKFCQADKGGSIVLFDLIDYKQMVAKHLDDKTTYIVTRLQEKDIRLMLEHFVKFHEGSLIGVEKSALLKDDTTMSSFYVLPKLHKSETIVNHCEKCRSEYIHIGHCPADLKSRPIVNNINSPTEALSHFIDKLLTPFVQLVPGYIKDTFHFLSQLPKSCSTFSNLISMDVSSLYTMIPKQYGLIAIQYWLYTHPSKLDTRFSPAFILDALEIILTYNIFRYENTTYQQICGTAMGTKVAPKYAHLVMGYLEIEIKEKCIKSMGPIKTRLFFSNYWRYLDDIFIIAELCQSEIQQFLQIFNNTHDSFKFTYEVSNSKIHFLDVTIYKEGQIIKTDIFRKPTDSQQYLHFYSHHPRHIKRNLPYCLAKRLNSIVSDPVQKILRFEELKQRLLEIKYPLNLVNDAIKKASETHLLQHKPQSPEQETRTKQMFVPYTYNPSTVKQFKNRIVPSLDRINQKSFKASPYNFTQCLRQPPNLLQFLSKTRRFVVKKCRRSRCKTCSILMECKDSFTIANNTVYFNANMTCETPFVVYILLCLSCKQFYVGETNMKLSLRMNLHRSQIQHPERSILHVSEHLRECNYNYRVLPIYKSQHSSSYVLLRMEKYYINLLKPTLNQNVDY